MGRCSTWRANEQIMSRLEGWEETIHGGFVIVVIFTGPGGTYRWGRGRF